MVIEVVSDREGGEDTEKLQAYAEIGVCDYAIFDPDRLLSPELLRFVSSRHRSSRFVHDPRAAACVPPFPPAVAPASIELYPHTHSCRLLFAVL